MRVLSLRRPIDIDGPIGRTSRFSNGNGRGLYRNPRKHTAIRGGLARRRVLRAARMNGLIRVDDHRGTQTGHVQKQKRRQQDGQSEFRSALHTPCRIACTPRATNPRSNIPHGFAPLSTRRFGLLGQNTHSSGATSRPTWPILATRSVRMPDGRAYGRAPCFGIVFACSTCIVVGSDG